MRFLFLFYFLLLCQILVAQENLVSNGSFELMSHCGSGMEDIDELIDVSAATNGSIDIRSEICEIAPLYIGNNVYKSKDGNNFMGFATQEWTRDVERCRYPRRSRQRR